MVVGFLKRWGLPCFYAILIGGTSYCIMFVDPPLQKKEIIKEPNGDVCLDTVFPLNDSSPTSCPHNTYIDLGFDLVQHGYILCRCIDNAQVFIEDPVSEPIMPYTEPLMPPSNRPLPFEL